MCRTLEASLESERDTVKLGAIFFMTCARWMDAQSDRVAPTGIDEHDCARPWRAVGLDSPTV